MRRALNSRRAVRSSYRGSLCLVSALTLILAPVRMLGTSYTYSVFRAAKMNNDSQHLENVLQYISVSWDHLTRSLDKCKTYEDDKIGDGPILYFPADYKTLPSVRDLGDNCKVRIERLPEIITSPDDVHLHKIPAAGLLYVPHPYIVPGGQFNEMYGWDSYFII
jgi:alpha,alpha-trehalase